MPEPIGRLPYIFLMFYFYFLQIASTDFLGQIFIRVVFIGRSFFIDRFHRSIEPFPSVGRVDNVRFEPDILFAYSTEYKTLRRQVHDGLFFLSRHTPVRDSWKNQRPPCDGAWVC